MHRRRLLQTIAAAPLAGCLPRLAPAAGAALQRVRPQDPDWPSAARWQQLNDAVGGNLLPGTAAVRRLPDEPPTAPPAATCCANIRNPFWIGDQPGGTQVSGWLDAWTPAPSAYAVKARHSADVAAAVNFARDAAAAPGGQRRRPQLPGHLQRARLAAHLDAGNERGDAARGLRRRRLCGQRRAGAGGQLRRRRHVDRSVQRRDHPRRPLRAGRRLHQRRRRRTGAKRRFRQFLERLRHRRRAPAGGGSRHRRRPRAHRQRLRASGPVLGAARAAAAAASAW